MASGGGVEKKRVRTVRKKKKKRSLRTKERAKDSVPSISVLFPAPNPLCFDPKPIPQTTYLPHSAMSAAVPMEKSLIDGEAGNDELLGFWVALFDADDAKPPASLLLFPPSAADERCERRRMSEDMVVESRVSKGTLRRGGGGGG